MFFIEDATAKIATIFAFNSSGIIILYTIYCT